MLRSDRLRDACRFILERMFEGRFSVASSAPDLWAIAFVCEGLGWVRLRESRGFGEAAFATFNTTSKGCDVLIALQDRWVRDAVVQA